MSVSSIAFEVRARGKGLPEVAPDEKIGSLIFTLVKISQKSGIKYLFIYKHILYFY